MADYSLALNVKPLQLEDPLTVYGKFATIQNAQNQNALAQYQLSAAQRGEEENNQLRALFSRADVDRSSPDFVRQIYAISPGKGQEYTKNLLEERVKGATLQKTESDLLASEIERSSQALAAAPNIQSYKSIHNSIHKDPTSRLGKYFASIGFDKTKSDEMIAQAENDPSGELFSTLRNMSGLKGKELADYIRTQTEVAQMRLPSQPGAMPSRIPAVGAPVPAPTGIALGTPVAENVSAMAVPTPQFKTRSLSLETEPPAPAAAPESAAAPATTFAKQRLAAVEKEIGDMQTVLASFPGNKKAADALKAAVEERAKLVSELSPKTDIEKLQEARARLSPTDPRLKEIDAAIDKLTQSTPHYVSSEQGVMAVDPRTNIVTPVLVNGKPLLDSSTVNGQEQLKIARQRLNLSAQAERRLQEEADSSGGLSPQALDIAAQMVVQSGVMPPLGSGKNASLARVQVMNRVAEMTGTDAAAGASNIIGNQQNTLAAKKTLTDFTSGISARKVTSNNTAINHLQTMYELANDLNNKDIRIVNAAGNAFATATGQPAPTNFNAAKQLVAAEVIKAVVNNGGGVTERQEAAESFARANSPEQLKGVINTYRVLLGGQLESLEGQYKAGTGRDDFRSKFLTPNTQKVLPAAPAAAKTPSDIPQAAIDFLKQGRGTREQFDAQFGAGSAKKVLGN